MNPDYLTRIQNFTLSDLPDLDEVVFGALAFLTKDSLPNLDVHAHVRPLVIGSGNAYVTGQVLFRDTDAVFADEGNYEAALARVSDIDAIYLISASGGKHAVRIAERLADMNRPLYLLTNNVNAAARAYVQSERVLVYPRMREPYTYNTSTYLSMLLAESGESATALEQFIREEVVPKVPEHIGTFDSYIFIIPQEWSMFKTMYETKFDELFGPRLHARIFTIEETKHAKTVIPSDSQCFIAIGTENTLFGTPAQRFHFPLPPNYGPAAIFTVGYTLIGNIQRRKPPYFKDNIGAYAQHTSEIFGESIAPIVE